MSKFRKKPVVIEAVQFTSWYQEVEGVTIDFCPDCPDCNAHVATIDTLEGRMQVSLGDWIVTGVKGERYAVKPDIFALTYEPAGEWYGPQVRRTIRAKAEAVIRGAHPCGSWAQVVLELLDVVEAGA